MFDFSKLHQGVCVVTFTKVDGTERVMKCTTALAQIPQEFQPKGEGVEAHEGQHRVFDIEAQGWRSFNESQVTAFEFLG